MRKRSLIIIALISIVLSCSLDHSNPLDPSNSGIEPPTKVTGIVIDIANNNEYIQINWDNVVNAEGYFIYRSEYIDGFYKRIYPERVSQDSIETYEDYDVTLPPPEGTHYWYKMSAYKFVNGDTLEGYRSEPKTWN